MAAEPVDNSNGCTGGFTAPDGQNTWPYKADERPIHHPMDYTSDEINREVA